MRLMSIVLHWLALLALLLISACSGAGDATSASSTTTVLETKIDGYSVPQDARSAVRFRLNTIGVLGKIVEVRDPAVVSLSRASLEASGLPQDDDLNHLVSTPVDIEVTEVFFGANRVSVGDRLTLRIIGGTAQGRSTESDFEKALDSMRPGVQVASFSGDPVQYEKGIQMFTPTQLFIGESGELVPGFDPTTGSTSLGEIRDLVKEREELEAELESAD